MLNMKKCPCSFYENLVNQLFMENFPSSTGFAALRKDAESCCCLALFLFLTYRCDDTPTFLTEIKEIINEIYKPSEDG